MYVSIVAYLALVLLIPLSAVIYAILRPPAATAAVFLTAILFLPEGVSFDAPALPPFDKHAIAGLCALVGTALTASGALRRAQPGRGVDWFATLLFLGLVGTSVTNGDPLTYGHTYLPALSLYDAFSQAVRLGLHWIIPFFLGRALYRNADDLRDLMVVVVVAALLYLPLVVIELRLSPQLHRIVYGFHQHDFIQTVRAGGGFRPMVFMRHGLALAMFLLTATLFAAALARSRTPLFSMLAGPVAGLLGLILILCKSLGALVYALALLPLLVVARARLQTRLAVFLAALVVAYPLLRITDVFPTDSLVNAAAQVSQQRADSLAFRFYNEDQLVQKALERNIFGWGSFGRNRIYNDWGTDVSVTDGHWIIALGGGGVVGFIGTFGLLLAPVFMARRRLSEVPFGRDRLLIGALAVVVAVNVVDLLPNALYSGLTLLLAGALAGVVSERRSGWRENVQ